MEPNVYKYLLKYSTPQQIILTLMALLSFPFLYLFYELPKTIVNDAILAKSDIVRVPLLDIELDQMTYLFVLAGLFLLLVIVNQGFKYVINVYRGLTGERLLRRLPKVGFNPHRPRIYQIVNVFELNKFTKDSTVSVQSLKERKLIGSVNKPVKILGKGELKKALIVQIEKTSKAAQEKITSAGGKIEAPKLEKDKKQEEKDRSPRHLEPPSPFPDVRSRHGIGIPRGRFRTLFVWTARATLHGSRRPRHRTLHRFPKLRERFWNLRCHRQVVDFERVAPV